MKECMFKDNQEKAKTECGKYDTTRTSNTCLHFRFDEYCLWVKGEKSTSVSSKSKS